ncbi:MAG: DUF3187 family protein [Desulfobacterales bacterium]
MKPLKTFLNLLAMTAVLTLYAIPGLSETVKGPLRTRNQFPPFLMFLSPLPESPATLSKNELKVSPAVDYSSVFINEYSENWDVLIDMELTVVDLLVEYGVTNKLTLSVQPLLVSMNKGFLDSSLETYHDAFNFPNYGRENRPKNEFGYAISYRNQKWFDGKPGGLHIADSLISAKYSMLEGSRSLPVNASMLYTLKIPVGDADSGFGSGHFDHGLFLLTQTVVHPVIIYANAGYIFLSDPDTKEADIDVNNIPSLFGGLEYSYSEKLSLIAQINYFASPFNDSDFSQFDNGSVELDLGFVYHFSQKTRFEFAFAEDLAQSGVPDFNVHLRVSYVFNREP